MESWAARAVDAIARRDGFALTACVSARGIVDGRDASSSAAPGEESVESIERRARERVGRRGGAREPWDETLSAFYAASMGGTRWAVEAADAHARGVKGLVKAFRGDDDGAWAAPAGYACVDDARAFAERADAELKRRGEKPCKLADVGSTLMLVYRAVSQTASHEKKAPAPASLTGGWLVAARVSEPPPGRLGAGQFLIRCTLPDTPVEIHPHRAIGGHDVAGRI